ncbi:uncharacterized protein K489DRAFT_383768 [Dissoconium aciculare CBS 342.82]|uniref:Uncharacterized protein n=1 Tax=Dissoconium aciculare CBS 342.82 TaxID=1314786 RepID=A0A6J3LUT4_9PEZI|nr:uncharacterized protein K489DRAFT_383768 [Dissoconium aciculare CBS 342.82]KAF1819535.1 hypothetical protein K489DRAFT_383768 [Dissoconium aciculare CBS 342.82]
MRRIASLLGLVAWMKSFEAWLFLAYDDESAVLDGSDALYLTKVMCHVQNKVGEIVQFDMRVD